MQQYRKPIIYGVTLVVIFLAHLTYIPNGFVWLDHTDIEAGHALVKPAGLAQILSSPFGQTSFYRPLVTLFTSTDYWIYHAYAPGYHLTNVLFHTAVVAVVPLFLSVFLALSFPEVIVVMLLVGLHPLGWLPVGAISYRPELLMTFFVMLTVYFHARTRETGKPPFAILTVLSFFLTLLSKETALITPLLLILWEMTKKHKKSHPILLLYVPEAAVLCLYLFLRWQAVPQIWHAGYFQASLSEAIGTRIFVLEKLLWYLVDPLKPSLSDAVRLQEVGDAGVVGAVGVVGILLLLVALVGHKNKTIFVPFILLGLLLLPALDLVPVPRLGSPHYGYLALTGFAGIVIILIRKRRWTYGLLAVWLAVACFTTVNAGVLFKNDQTLFTPEVARDHSFLEGYFYLGNYYAQKRDYKHAENAYRQALVTDPQVVAYHDLQATQINLGLVLLKENRRQAAISAFRKALPLADPLQNKKMELFIEFLTKTE